MGRIEIPLPLTLNNSFSFEVSSKLNIYALPPPIVANEELSHIPEDQLENLPTSKNATSTECLPIRHVLSICSFNFYRTYTPGPLLNQEQGQSWVPLLQVYESSAFVNFALDFFVPWTASLLSLVIMSVFILGPGYLYCHCTALLGLVQISEPPWLGVTNAAERNQGPH